MEIIITQNKYNMWEYYKLKLKADADSKIRPEYFEVFARKF